MTSNKHLAGTIGVVLAAAVGLAACGGSSSSSTASGSSPQASGATSVGPGQPNPAAPAYARILQNSKVTVDTSQWKKQGPYHIAALTQGPINAWGSLFDTELKVDAKKNSNVASMDVYPSMGNAEKQIQDMSLLINKKPDAIILTPMNVASLSASIARAKAAGIPTITCQARSNGTGWVTEVSQPLYPNNYAAAAKLADMLGGKGNVVILTGFAGVDMADISKTAAEDALKNYPGIKIVGSGAGNWSVADSKNLTAGWIAKNPQIDGVLALGMEMGLGAAQAFLDAGKPIPVVAGTGAMNGFNRLAIENDVKFWSKAFDPSVSKVCLETALQVLNGQSVKKFIDAETQMDGTWLFDSANAKVTYKPALNDQLPLGPTGMTDAELASAGFKR
jgi:ABC-type sugar transport system substrate-binding protein